MDNGLVTGEDKRRLLKWTYYYDVIKINFN